MITGPGEAAALQQFGGMEWIIFLIVVGVLLLFGPSKLPEFARSIGRAWGEFRKGKMEVEREIRAELARDEGGEVLAVRDEVMRAARTLSVPTEGKDMKEIKLGIAKAIDTASTSQVIATAKAFGLNVEGVGVQTVKEQIIRRLAV